MWRSLTSMRIALPLLFLLSVTAIPGSLLPPQREIDPTKVIQFYSTHPGWAPFMDALQLFDVFESVWVRRDLLPAVHLADRLHPAALAGPLRPCAASAACRAAQPQAAAGTRRPSARPLPPTRRWPQRANGSGAGASAPPRARTRPDVVSAEKAMLRETGNLLFHLSLIGILIAVAVGHFFGFKGRAACD